MKDPIKALAAELKPFHTMDSFKAFIGKWFFFSALIVLISHLLLPVREDLLFKTSDWTFEIENFLWFSTSFLSAAILYFSCFPEKHSLQLIKTPAYIALGTIFLIFFARMDFAHTLTEAMNEMNLWRGRCGFIILFFSTVHASFLVYWAKNSAPRNTYTSGFWGALSASSLGCLLMQVVCAHDNSAHLILWHFIPLMGISFAGGMAAKKLLRW